jgi:hypothetical protein
MGLESGMSTSVGAVFRDPGSSGPRWEMKLIWTGRDEGYEDWMTANIARTMHADTSNHTLVIRPT